MKIILLILLTGVTSNHAQRIKICTTPDNKQGNCKPIRSCDSMVKYLLAKENFTLEERQFLNKYQCDYINNSPLICCPHHGIIVPSLGSSRKGETPSTANVKDHRNLRLLPTDCGLPWMADGGDRIIMGNETGLFEFPWMVLLSYYQTSTGAAFKCGGTVINDRYILTAGHCILDSLLGVRVGEHSISIEKECEEVSDDDNNQNITSCAEPYQDIYVEEKILHSKYNVPHKAANDIALLRLATPIRMSNSVKPICLPIEEDVAKNIYLSTKYIVTGWGATNTSDSSDKLLKTRILPVKLESCQAIYESKMYTITDIQFCAGTENGSDSCNGDSGGPVQMREFINGKSQYFQGGIVSIGPTRCADPDIPAVYTKVDKYLNWILDNLIE